MHNVIGRCKNILEDVHNKYKTPEFYLLGEKHQPIELNLGNLENMLQSENRKQIQRVLLSHLLGDARLLFERVGKKFFPQGMYAITIPYLVATTLHHAGNRELCRVLLYELITNNITVKTERKERLNPPSKSGHAFVVVYDSQQIPWVLDPCLNICCSYSEYPQNPRVKEHLESILESADNCTENSYSLDPHRFRQILPTANSAIETLSNGLTESEQKELKAIKEELKFVVSLDEESFQSEETRARLRLIISKRIVNEIKKLILIQLETTEHTSVDFRMLLLSGITEQFFVLDDTLTTSGQQWRTMPAPESGKFAGHDLRFLRFQQHHSAQAKRFCKLLSTQGFYSSVRKTKQTGKPSVVVDLTDSMQNLTI